MAWVRGKWLHHEELQSWTGLSTLMGGLTGLHRHFGGDQRWEFSFLLKSLFFASGGITRDITELLLRGKCASRNKEITLFLLTERPFGDHSPRATAWGLKRDLCLALLSRSSHVCPHGRRTGTGSCKSWQHLLPRGNYIQKFQS